MIFLHLDQAQQEPAAGPIDDRQFPQEQCLDCVRSWLQKMALFREHHDSVSQTFGLNDLGRYELDTIAVIFTVHQL